LGELVGAGGGTAAAMYAGETAARLVCIHAFEKGAETFGIAVTSAHERYVVELSVYYFKTYLA